MTNKRLDRKFMSWVWGIVRLLPMFYFSFMFIYYIFCFKGVGFVYDDNVGIIINSFYDVIFGGANDIVLDSLSYGLMPSFMQDIYYNLIDFVSPNSYLIDIVISFTLYQVWISILQLFINVIMILPNITNWFIEKFVHLGNKGDY